MQNNLEVFLYSVIYGETPEIMRHSNYDNQYNLL